MSDQPNIVQTWLVFIPPPLGFRLQGKLTLPWTVPIANTTLNVGELHGTIEVHPQQGSLRPYAFQAVGQLHNFFGINTSIQFHSDSDNPDAVFTAVLTDQDLNKLNVAQLVDGVAGQDTWSTTEKPGDFPTLSYSSVSSNQAGLYINIDRQVFICYAGIKQLGRAAILVQRIPGATTSTAQWGFALVASLDPDWRFQSISESLKVVDDVLKIEVAYIAIASFPVAGKGPVLPNLKLVPHLPDLAHVAEMGTGVNLYAKLKFSTTLFENVKHMLTTLDENAVTLYAHFKPKAVETIFSASLGGFKLFDAVTFEHLTLSYQPYAGKTLKLLGVGAVTIPDADGVEHTFKFNGALLVSEREADFKLQVQEQPTLGHAPDGSAPTTALANPLGMRGITLRNLQLFINYNFVKKTSFLAVLADVTIGSTSGFQARIIFQNGRPMLVSIELKALPIGQMLLSVLPEAPWPADFAELILSGRLYYASVRFIDPTNPALIYEQGFRADAGIMLHGFAAWIGIAITPRQGIQAAGYLSEPIDWGFLQITGAQPTAGPAIALARSTSRTSFTLRAGVKFLDAGLIAGDIQVNKQEFQAQLTGHVDTFGDLRLTCTWSKQRGFQIKEWPFDLQIPKEIKQLENILTNLGTCSQVVGKALDLVIPFTGKFGVKSQVSLEEKKILKLVLHCHFKLNAGSTTAALVTVQLQEFTLRFDFNKHGKLTFAQLPDKIFGYVQDNAGPLLEAFFTDPVALAKLLTCLGVKYAPKVLIDVLVCKGWLKEAAVRFVQSLLQGVVSAIVGMAGEVLPYVLGGLGVLISILAGGIVMVVAVLSPIPHGMPQDQVLDKPAGVRLVYADGQLTITWQPVKDARDYAYQLTAADGTIIASSATYQIDTEGNLVQQPTHLNDPPIIVGDDALAEGVTYTFVVRAAGEHKLGLLSDPVTITILPTPTSLQMTFIATTLTASWSAVPGAASYDFELLDSTGAIVVSSRELQATSVTYDQPQLEPGKTYLGRLRATSAQVVGRWSAQRPIVIPGTAQPPTLWYADAQLSIGWEAVAGATTYDYQVLNDSQVVLAASDLSATSTTIRNPPLEAGASYRAQIRGTALNATGTWSTPTELHIVALEAPPNLAVSIVDNRIDVGWLPVPNAASYTAQVLDQAGQMIARQSQVYAPPVSLAQGLLRAGSTYSVQVRAQTSMVGGPWSTTKVTVLQLTAPVDVTASVSANRVEVQWSAVPQALAYEVEVLDAQDLVVLREPAVQDIRVMLPADVLRSGQVYSVKVRALARGESGPWSNPVTLRPPETPEQLAHSLSRAGASLLQATLQVKQAFPTIMVAELAQALQRAFELQPMAADALRLTSALRDAGFGSEAAALGLDAALPELSADVFEATIAIVFGADVASQMARDLATLGYSLADTARQINQALGAVAVEELAQALGQAFDLKTPEDAIRLCLVLRDAGFRAEAAAQGLQAAMPELSADAFEAAIEAAFGGA